jgi:Cu-Zn family superoxide dismutase
MRPVHRPLSPSIETITNQSGALMRAIPSAVILLATLTACMQTGGASASSTTGSGNDATATIRDVNGRELGTLTVTEDRTGLVTAGTLRGLKPGLHAIHIHTVGRCEPPFDNAGAHWNPAERRHGFENPAGPHMGDMQNFTVADDSTGTLRVSTPGGTLRNAIPVLDADGSAIVVHALPDDYRTDPSGNSGARVACGVVRG